jgi:ketosteroid isomerase-like protein
MLKRDEIIDLLGDWYERWNAHDLDGVMDLFHEDVQFENWTGARVRGRENLRQAWSEWFANHGGFQFVEEDTIVDEATQTAVYQWRLEWPSLEEGFQGKMEIRHGLDVLHFREGRIARKRTYSKTTLEIDGKRVRLVADGQN